MNFLLRSLGIVGLLGLPLFAQEAQETAVPVDKAALVKKSKAKQAPREPSSVQKPRPGTKASGGNSWFPVTVRELGTFYGQGEAVGVFQFTNPHDQEIEWRGLTPSCQCAKAEIRIGDRIYRVITKPQKRLVRVISRDGQPDKLENVRSITIGPKESGEVETRLNMHNITGGKSATLDIHSTDPVEPHIKLTFRATGAQLFQVSPKEVNLNKMTWNETREFTARVSSTVQKDWEILAMDDAGEAFDVSWEKVQNGENTSYVIHGKYSPGDSEHAGGGVLKFRTNVNGTATFSLRVLAFVQGPLEVKPGGFLTLGLIRRGKPISKKVEFIPNDGVDLQATELVFEKTSLAKEFIQAKPSKDGKKLVIELSVSDNAPKGLVRGELVVKLNHPLVKEKRILFNGFVR
ncbi:MAG TPA: hypothetical protein ENI87_09925 [bacterium]|nr:hypothetical protein [bacterium]